MLPNFFSQEANKKNSTPKHAYDFIEYICSLLRRRCVEPSPAELVGSRQPSCARRAPPAGAAAGECSWELRRYGAHRTSRHDRHIRHHNYTAYFPAQIDLEVFLIIYIVQNHGLETFYFKVENYFAIMNHIFVVNKFACLQLECDSVPVTHRVRDEIHVSNNVYNVSFSFK
jgi:hypothetical protein